MFLIALIIIFTVFHDPQGSVEVTELDNAFFCMNFRSKQADWSISKECFFLVNVQLSKSVNFNSYFEQQCNTMFSVVLNSKLLISMESKHVREQNLKDGK